MSASDITALVVIAFVWALLLGVSRLCRSSSPFDQAVPHKGGHNDLSRWEAFGGTLKRPDPPSPIEPEGSLRRRPF